MPLFRPVVEPVVDRFPRAETFGEVSPRHAGFRPEEHGFDEKPISSRRFRASLLLRDDGPQATPLIIG
jgi:hypothetical protein